MKRLMLLGAAAMIATGCGDIGIGKKKSAAAPATPSGPSYVEVNDVLANNCGGCHSPGAKAPRVQFVGNETVLRAASVEIDRRINSTDPKVVMPPPRYHDPLSPADRALVTQFLTSAPS